MPRCSVTVIVNTGRSCRFPDRPAIYTVPACMHIKASCWLLEPVPEAGHVNAAKEATAM